MTVAERHVEPPAHAEQQVYVDQLYTYVKQRGGVLQPGWRVEVRSRKAGPGKEVLYFSPDNSRFSSRPDVARALGLPVSLVKEEGTGHASGNGKLGDSHSESATDHSQASREGGEDRAGAVRQAGVPVEGSDGSHKTREHKLHPAANLQGLGDRRQESVGAQAVAMHRRADGEEAEEEDEEEGLEDEEAGEEGDDDAEEDYEDEEAVGDRLGADGRPLEAKDLPGLNERQIPVICNDVRGSFLVTKQQVICNCKACLPLQLKDRLFTPCQFERHAGSKAKKWKISIKLDPDSMDEPDGTLFAGDQPMTIGQWYDKHGIEVKPLYKKVDSLGDAGDPAALLRDALMLKKRKRSPPQGAGDKDARLVRPQRLAAKQMLGDFVARRERRAGSFGDGHGPAEDGQDAIAGLMQLTRGGLFPGAGVSSGAPLVWRADSESMWGNQALLSSWERGDRVSSGLVAGNGDGPNYWKAKFDSVQQQDSYFKHKVIFQLMLTIMDGQDRRALYEEYLPVLNDMPSFRLEQEYNTFCAFLDMVDEMDFEAVKADIRRYVNGVLRHETRKLSGPPSLQLLHSAVHQDRCQ